MSGHPTKQYGVVEIAMNLFAACMISGIIIAGTYYFTAPVAAEKAEMLKTQAMQALVKDADSFTPVEGKAQWFEAQKNNEIVAYVVPGESKGFGGEILMLVAVSPEGKVLDFDILKHNETPGLGDLANKEGFKSGVRGKAIENLEVTKDPANAEGVQAITGATISSRAVTKGVREAAEEVAAYLEDKQ